MRKAAELVAQMSHDTGILPGHLQTLIRTAPLRYKVFYIAKRSGGLREVAQPAREVKAIQRWLVRQLESQLPVHQCASAYRRGSSIKDNAERHINSSYLLKLDFKDFFPSIVASDIVRHLELHCSDYYDSVAMALIARACTWAPKRLPPLRICIGAPSSPLLSNSIMYDFDVRLTEVASAEGVTYSRYADDITLSSHDSNVVGRFAGVVADIVGDLEYPKLQLNKKKTVLASRSIRRVVTGVTLTPDGSLSIGRERKRLIRAMFHRSALGLLDGEELQRLNGLLAFADSIEPGFSSRLRGVESPD